MLAIGKVGRALALLALLGPVACQTSDLDSKPNSIFAGDPLGDLSPRTTRRGGDVTATDSGYTGRAVGKPLTQSYGPEPAGITLVGLNEASTSGGYSLNFENTDIKEVIRAVLNDALNVSYTIAGDISGPVTISSARPVSKDALLKSLESALTSFNFSLTKVGEGYRVAATGASAGTVDVGRQTTPGFGVSIIPLRFVSASSMMELLAGFVAQADGLRVNSTGNAIFARGSAPQRDEVIKAVLSFDSDFMEDQSVAIFRLRQARPEDVVPELERIFDAKGENNIIQFRGVARVRGVMAISKNSALLRRAESWVRRLDQEDADTGQNVVVYKARYRKAEELARVMNNLFGGRTASAPKSRAPRDNAPTPGSDDMAADGSGDDYGAQSAGDVRVASAFDDPVGGAAVDGLEPGPNVVDLTEDRQGGDAAGKVSISADPANNSVVIYADSDRAAEIMTTLRKLDATPLQVAINVTIAEVRLTKDLKYGVQYYLNSKRLGLGTDNGSISLVDKATKVLESQVPGLNFVLGANANPDVIISALDGIGDVEVLSSPSVVVLENQPATLQVGDEVPITTRQSQSVENGLAPVINQVEFKNTGIILKVTPRISHDDTVTMQIEQEISNVSKGGDTLTPTISKRRVQSEISVNDQQTVLLGGLISDSTDDGKRGIPGLIRIPVVGNLFGTTQKKGNRTELIVLIRPSIIRNGQEAADVANDLKSQMYIIGSRKTPLK